MTTREPRRGYGHRFAADAVVPVGRGTEVQRSSSPGKATLVERPEVESRVPWAGHAEGDGESPAHVQAAAVRGTSGAGEPLPYLSMIQRCFGRHDVSGVVAHTDPVAVDAASSIGAEAFATGSHVAFAGAPSLHTAAHEAAHVVQQRAGVSLKGGVGQVGDPYEQHADAVADGVVRGDSVEALLDAHVGTGGTGIQRMGKKSGAKPTKAAVKVAKPKLVTDLINDFEDKTKHAIAPLNKELYSLYTAPDNESVDAQQQRLQLVVAKQDELTIAHACLQAEKDKLGLSDAEQNALTYLEDKLTKLADAIAPPAPAKGPTAVPEAKPSKAELKGFKTVTKDSGPAKKQPSPAKLKPVSAQDLLMRTCMELGVKPDKVATLPVTVDLCGSAVTLHITMPADGKMLPLDNLAKLDEALDIVHVTAELYGQDDTRNPRAFRSQGWKVQFPEEVPKGERAKAADVMKAQGQKWDGALSDAIQFLIHQQQPMY